MKNIVFPFEKNWAIPISAENTDIQLVDVGVHDYSTMKPCKNNEIVPNATFHFVISGKGKLNLFNKEYPLASGDLFYIPPHTEKSYFPSNSDPWKYCFFTIKGASVNRFFLKCGFSDENPVFHTEKNAQAIADAFNEMITALFDHKLNYFAFSELFAMSALYKICAIITCERNISNPLTTACKTYSDHIKYHLEHHFHEPNMSVTRLCSEMFFSQSYLSKLFKKENGITIQEYIARLRINTARDLLKQTDMTVKQIAEYVGYTDIIAFSRMFKKLTGVNPSEYRENFLKNSPPPPRANIFVNTSRFFRNVNFYYNFFNRLFFNILFHTAQFFKFYKIAQFN